MSLGSHHDILIRLLSRAALFCLLVSSQMLAQELRLVWDNDKLRVSAPKFHFLTGRALDAARNGRTVAFDFQLSLLAGGVILKRAVDRFVISYDLWEERYLVTRLGVRKEQSNLTQESAEIWCLENLALTTSGIAPDRAVNVQLEVRVQDPRDNGSLVGEPGISLYALIELFSRPARSQQQKWNLQQGPLRLNDVKAAETAGSKGL